MPERWIGIDLNTTGYVAVVADPVTGFTARLGQEARFIHDSFNRERKKIRNSRKSGNLKRLDKRETGQLMDFNKYLSREIVSIASELGCGIKFERLSGNRRRIRKKGMVSDFSINNWYFRHLCQMVENRAVKQGIAVLYVDPSFTSQRCSCCGALGYRHRKNFSCPQCGYTGHADVNAAFNIARSPQTGGEEEALKKASEIERTRIKKEIRKIKCRAPGEDKMPAGLFEVLFRDPGCEA